MPIIINSSTDWQLQLVQDVLLTVVDPLVLCCGELFLKGAKAVENKNDA